MSDCTLQSVQAVALTKNRGRTNSNYTSNYVNDDVDVLLYLNRRS